MNSSLCNKKPTQNDEQLTEMYHDKLKHITPQRHVNTDRKQEYSSLQNNLFFYARSPCSNLYVLLGKF